MSLAHGPVPSRLVLLSTLPTITRGEKVRFMGCVTDYSPRLGCLTLQHDYPRDNQVKVLVDVNLVLDQLKATDIQTGEWVNIIGYYNGEQLCAGKSRRTASMIQAIVLWSAGAIDLDGYEQSLRAQAEVFP